MQQVTPLPTALNMLAAVAATPAAWLLGVRSTPPASAGVVGPDVLGLVGKLIKMPPKQDKKKKKAPTKVHLFAKVQHALRAVCAAADHGDIHCASRQRYTFTCVGGQGGGCC